MAVALSLLLLVSAAAEVRERTFELHLQIEPKAPAAVYIQGSITPFSAAGRAGPDGRARFKNLLPGPYTVSAVVRGHGEAQQTVEVGPSTADSKGRVRATLRVAETGSLPESTRQRAQVSARQLSVPERARKEYLDAQKKLERRDIEGAIAHLQKAVELAPQFVVAWNNLGTIAYQTKRYAEAEKYFRQALEQEADAYDPLVNLGGTLLSLERYKDALPYNLHAVQRRPEDALANSQLGMNYFFLGRFELGIKHLAIAKKIDPAHFSLPQLTLAEIYLQKNEKHAAADELEEFLRFHPDWPAAASVREAIGKLRKARE